jgi:cation diffusion facilitator CzcD-associated flavoprotein CzcO/acetyl esterase/lipase
MAGLSSRHDTARFGRLLPPPLQPAIPMSETKPSGFTDALIALVLRTVLRLLLKPALSPRLGVATQRRWLARLTALTVTPNNVKREQGSLGGVPGEWLRPGPAAPAKPGAVLYLHGGAYCVGSPATHRGLTARLAHDTGLPVFALDYRLAPEHPFPAALDDALAAFHALRAEGPVVLAGDSAGGGLALAAAIALRDAGRLGPAALLLASPWVDLDLSDAPAAPKGEAMLSLPWMLSCREMALGRSTAQEQAWASPLHANLRGLPPTLVQVGTDEILNPQALALHAALQAAGVESQCDVTRGRWHVFQLNAGVLPSANAAVARMAHFVMEPLAESTPPGHSEHTVVIMGAGMSGLCTAIQLQAQGIHDFVILEKQQGLGGTWWDNTYPGAQVDVPAPVYAFSFAPNTKWRQRFADSDEIQHYMQGLAEKHALLGRMRLGTRLSDARFDAATGHWHFQTERGDTLRSRFFVCSTGPLSQPRWPDIPGLDEFQGKRLHTARWDHDYALEGKRVAVIGTGSTAAQVVPPLAEKAATLHVFQRTANWVLPRLDRRYFGIDRWLASFPPYAKATRWAWAAFLEWGRRGFDEGTFARRLMLTLAAWQRRRHLPTEALREALTPPYPLGCKRIIYSNTYYPTLAQAHVELVTTGIDRITAHGIVSADGQERPIDALVCATGFDTVHLLNSVRIIGRQGRSLSEAWVDGPEAFHGVSVAGFPNMFLTLGPNTATGHTSTLLFIEPEVQHAIACMKTVLDGGHRWLDVREDAQRLNNAQLQGRLAHSVWSQCRSWYRMDSGRIVALFPGFTDEYVAAVRGIRSEDYELG